MQRDTLPHDAAFVCWLTAAHPSWRRVICAIHKHPSQTPVSMQTLACRRQHRHGQHRWRWDRWATIRCISAWCPTQ